MNVDDNSFWEDDDTGPYICDACEGTDQIVVCCDDICVGQGYCMHGDGMADCPECGGVGEFEK